MSQNKMKTKIRYQKINSDNFEIIERYRQKSYIAGRNILDR